MRWMFWAPIKRWLWRLLRVRRDWWQALWIVVGNNYASPSPPDLVEQIVAVLPRRRPMVVLLVGQPGSGKSHLAKQLAPLLDCQRFNTDQIRKNEVCQGSQPTYSREENQLTYELLSKHACQAITKGRSLLADGTFLETQSRLDFCQRIRAAGAEVAILEVTAPWKVIRTRLNRKWCRQQQGLEDNPSDANFQVWCDFQRKLETQPERYSLPTANEGLVWEVNTWYETVYQKVTIRHQPLLS